MAMGNLSVDQPDRIRATSKGNCDRLVQVTGTYDPDGLFHLNQNIEPQRSGGRHGVG